MTSEQILNDLIKTLQSEITEQEKTLNTLSFAIKTKKARLKKLQGEYQTDKTPLSEDKPA
jgi:uncharacterized coiled-coil protein SlyX